MTTTLRTVRRDAYERGIGEEAERQGALAERNRNRMNEMLTGSYERAVEWLEDAQPSDLRPQDVIQIIRLHMDAVKAFEVSEKPREDEWTEEDEREIADIIREIDAQAEQEPEEDSDDEEDYEIIEGNPD